MYSLFNIDRANDYIVKRIAKKKMEAVGIELTTYRMRSDRSTTELCPRVRLIRKTLYSI